MMGPQSLHVSLRGGQTPESAHVSHQAGHSGGMAGQQLLLLLGLARKERMFHFVDRGPNYSHAVGSNDHNSSLLKTHCCAPRVLSAEQEKK